MALRPAALGEPAVADPVGHIEQEEGSDMAQFSWKPRANVAPGRDYTVMSSKLPLESHRSIPGFMRDTLAIRRQLGSAPGLVGCALLAELANKTFWTFSVWETRESLDEFARSSPHDEIIPRSRASGAVPYA
jgi:hypothetical protein